MLQRAGAREGARGQLERLRKFLVAGSRRQEAAAKRKDGVKPRRWVVERTHSWLNRFRRLLVRWEKKSENYLAMLHLAYAIICFRSAG